MCGRTDPEPVAIDGTTATFREHVERMIQQHGLGDVMRFLGYVPDLTVAIGASDIVVMPSKEEPYGLVALEGMAMAKPIVATRAGGVPEFVVEGETGLLVPPGDSEALADALLKLLSNPARAREMGFQGRRHVLAEYTVSHYVARLMPVLEGVAGGGRQTMPSRNSGEFSNLPGR